MLKSWIDRQYDQGRETAVSAGEMEELVKTFAADRFQKKEGSEVEKEPSTSLADHVFRTLEEEILSGRYENGETLTESRLCESMGVSRTPVREALRRLEQEGLVRMEAGKSARVLGVTGKDLCDIYDIRMRVEGLAARLAATHAKPEQLKRLEDVVELEEFYIAKGDPDKIRNMDSRFHQMIYEYADNYQLQLMLTDLHHRIQNYRRMSLNAPRRAVNMSCEHRQILEDIKRGDADAAEKNISEGDWVWIENHRGRARQRARVTYEVHKGTIAAQHGWWFPEQDGAEPNLYGLRQSNINQLLANKPGRTGFGADLKCTLCKIYRCSEEDL